MTDSPLPRVVLEHSPRPGWANMALDLALLDEAEASGTVWWRLYRWEPHCLSFGRHEPAGRRYDRAKIAARGLDLVRRPTGGRAVWHARELTYAVAAPIDRFGSLPSAYGTIHAVLATAIRSLGGSPTIAPKHRPAGLDSGACFATPVGGEVLIGGRKVVGSAQRKGNRAFLQHGSLLLGDDQTTVREVQLGDAPNAHFPVRQAPELPLSVALGRSVDFAEAATEVIQALGPVLETIDRLEAGHPVLRRAERHYDTFRSEQWTWAR